MLVKGQRPIVLFQGAVGQAQIIRLDGNLELEAHLLAQLKRLFKLSDGKLRATLRQQKPGVIALARGFRRTIIQLLCDLNRFCGKRSSRIRCRPGRHRQWLR